MVYKVNTVPDIGRANSKSVSASIRVYALAFSFLAAVALCAAPVRAAELNNDRLRLVLDVSDDGIPFIAGASSLSTGKTVFTDAETGSRSLWLPDTLTTTSKPAPGSVYWRLSELTNIYRAEASRDFSTGVEVTWVVDLVKQGTMFRVHVRIKNVGAEPRKVKWFPAWQAHWNLTDSAKWVRWWEPLTFKAVEADLTSSDQIRLGSRLHSSDDLDDGVNPYWIVGGNESRLYFALDWCGGWDAKLEGAPDGGGLTFSVRLPPDETQLEIEPGETIVGPSVLITPTCGREESTNRLDWMKQRSAFAQAVYGGPLPSFPLTFNHWYSAGFDVDAAFLRRQVAAMTPYTFDAFIVDAGWYKKVGRWEPAPRRFDDGELEGILKSIKESGVIAGLWSSPQFVSSSSGDQGKVVQDPLYFVDFIEGYLLDLAESDFKNLLTDHVSTLRERYSMDWWKYDQEFFADESRAGAMRNVLAFQRALKAVRWANPDLTIENCQSGGRMINELTLLATQKTWLRDGDPSALAHARENIGTALGALEFVFPWAAYRWTNNFNKLGNDLELARFYCRSAMAGTWGISSDLPAITEAQRTVILKEIANYRRLNELKGDCQYEIQAPKDGADTAGVSFYAANRHRAAALVYRWDRKGTFEQRLVLSKLRPGYLYRVTDADTGTETVARGTSLMSDGVAVSFDGDRLSALLFVERAK